LPALFNATPEASTRRSIDTSRFKRSISASGILAMPPPLVSPRDTQDC